MGYTHYYYMPKEVVDGHWKATSGMGKSMQISKRGNKDATDKEERDSIWSYFVNDTIDSFLKCYENYHKVFKHSRAKIEIIELERDHSPAPDGKWVDAWNRNYAYIHFNGVGDLAHESFTFPPKQNGYEKDEDKYYFEFTKTNYKPYDQCVTAFLLIAKYFLQDDIILKSDGNTEDWIKGGSMANFYNPRVYDYPKTLVDVLQPDFDREMEQ